MTPLLKCRKAKKLTLQTLSSMLELVRGSSVTTLSRIEAGSVEKISKKMTNALVNIFEGTGLTENHILEPELYPDFNVNYSAVEEKNLCPSKDASFNEEHVLLNITEQWLSVSVMSETKFAVKLYEKLAADEMVTPVPTTADDFLKWKETAKKTIQRILNGEKPLPLSWKHYWLSCLPEHFKQTALSQIMANSGYMLIPLPTTPKADAKESRARIDEISHQFANVITSSKPAMDGFYDDRDDMVELQLLQDKLMELVASALRESTVIQACTGVTSKLQQIWANSPLNR